MAAKQTVTNQINSVNTSFCIHQFIKSEQSLEDLNALIALCSKNGNEILVTDKALKNIPETYHNNVILVDETSISNLKFDSIVPIVLPLEIDLTIVAKWITQASKQIKPNKIIFANGKFSDKLNILSKNIAYWSNFWPKLFSGVDANLSHSELYVIPVALFKSICLEKKIYKAWEMASYADKNNLLDTCNFDYKNKYFRIFDGARSIPSSFILGIKSTITSYTKTELKTNTWLDINSIQYKKTFGIISILLLVVMCIISFDYNVTWDEPNHNNYSKDVVKYYSSFGGDTTIFDHQKKGHQDYYTNNFYGMSIDVVSAGINSFIGLKNDYHIRHLLITLVGFLSILFTALTVRLFAGWLPACLTVIAMTFSPSYFGHCFNNPKDIPFAAGYIMALYYIIKLLMELPNPKHQTKVMLAFSIGFAISIRVQGVLGFVYLGLAMLLYWIFIQFKQKDKKFLHFLKIGLVISVSAYFLGILLWPYALRHPLTGPLNAIKEFSNFAYLTYYELFEGVRQYIKPWYYEPKIIMLTTPVIVLVGFGIGLLFGWIKKDKIKLIALFVLLFATFFPTFFTIYKKSYLYNGWRHFIFIYPSLMVIAMLGWTTLVQFINAQKVKVIVLSIIALTFIKPAIWSIANHPYQYMYFNEIAGGVKGAHGNYELDYWNQTPREAFAWLVKNRPEILKGNLRVSSNNIGESLKTYVPGSENVMYKWTREYEWANDDWKYAIWTSRTLSKSQIQGKNWPPKGTIYEVKVDGVTIAAVVESKNNYSHLAHQYLKKNNGDSALLFYQKAYEYNPLDEEYARGVAEAYKLKQNVDSALLFYKKALELRDGNYEAYYGIAECYYAKATVNPANPDKNLINKAIENFETASKYKENFSGVYYYLSEIYLGLDNKEKALENYALFFEYGQVNQQIYERMTQTLQAMGYKDIDAEPYYYLYNKAVEEKNDKKANMYLEFHNQVMSSSKK